VVALGVVLATAAPAVRGHAQARRYVEARGPAISTVEYRLSREGPSTLLTSVGPDSTDEIRWIPGSGTVEWRLTEPGTSSDILARRTRDVIRITGVLKNRAVDREVKVDGAPWYQVFGPLMEELLPPGSARREFWVLDPDDLSPHKMQVRRDGKERVTIRGTPVDAVKIHFSPAGALAPFWGADFWYRQSDGLWVTSWLPEHNAVTVSTVEELTP
jgi:hypothetical protein